MITYVGTEGAFAMLIATAVVAINGLVVNRMSMRFRRGGGYYTYANYSLTPRLGANTGWVYLAYALAYGGTLLAGGAFILYTILSSFNPPSIFLYQPLLALTVSSLASALVLMGVRVSAKYAMVMSTIEMITIVALAITFLKDSGWHFYNPITGISPALLEAVVFGLGIPTGYGSIAPLGYDASSKSIAKVAITVVFYGGLLAAFFFYALGALGFTGNLVTYLLTDFGLLGGIAIGLIALNDGTLGGMAYILANSRTLKAMSEDSVFPKLFAKDRNGSPFYAELAISTIFVSAVVTLTAFIGLFGAFTVLGGLAGIFNLFIHTSADLSLINITARKFKKHVKELTLGVIATAVSLFVLIYSFPSFPSSWTDFFLVWIIAGFLFLEVKEIANDWMQKDEEEKKE